MKSQSRKINVMNTNLNLLFAGHAQSTWAAGFEFETLLSEGLLSNIEKGTVKGLFLTGQPYGELAVNSNSVKRNTVSMEKKIKKTWLNAASRAADVLMPVYRNTNRLDGYVSVATSPALSFSKDGIIREAQYLWKVLARENIMIQVPSTIAGVAAIQQLIAEGINVLSNQIYSNARYCQVIEAFISGMEKRAQKGERLDRIAAVAAIHLPSIDEEVCNLFSGPLKGIQNGSTIKHLQKKAGIAVATLGYSDFLHAFNSERFFLLSVKGANPQRLMWACENYNKLSDDVPDLKEICYPETICSVNLQSLTTIQEPFSPVDFTNENLEAAREIVDQLQAETGIRIEHLTTQLENKFSALVAQYNNSQVINELALTG